MPYIGRHHFLITLPSGNQAVYEVQPQHVNHPELAMGFGKQVAHRKDGQWYKSGGWEEITDLKTIALLERVPAL